MIIDADAHVEESQAMFDRLDKEFRDRRPLPVRFEEDTVFGKYNAVWLIEGETYPKLVGKGGTIFRTPTLMEAASLKRESIGAQEMTDIDARLKDMDKVKIDTQVVFPQSFLDDHRRRFTPGGSAAAGLQQFLGRMQRRVERENPLCRAGADPRCRCIHKGAEASGENRRGRGHAARHGVG